MTLAVGVTALVIALVAVMGGSVGVWLWLAALMGFFAFGWYGPWVVAVAEAAPPTELGVTLAAAMTANQLAIVAAPPVFGAIVDASGDWRLAWILLALVVGAAGAWTRWSGEPT